MIRPEAEIWVRDFSPGFLDSPESDTLPRGATPDARNGFLYNIQIDGQRRAIMGRRAGCRLVNPTPLTASQPVDIFEWRRGASTPSMLAMCNGELWTVDPTTGTTTSIGVGWTAGRTARMLPFKTDAFVFDGAVQKRWDGVTLYDVGSGAPGVLTNPVVGAGTLTGTYEALYTWYNANRDHHSSPSETTATVVLVAQGRTHAIPGSAPPPWATHWGIWVRRTDTSELNFFFVQNVLLATLTVTETVSDVARQRGDTAPLPNANNAPPGAWAVLAEHLGYGIGILDGSDSIYVSRIGDLESWNPKDKFPVSRATGDFLTFAKTYGEQMWVGTGHATWFLEGDRVPFIPRSKNPAYGNVSQDACLEINGRFYGWDRNRGPYQTDGTNWRKLGSRRIETTLAAINKAEITDIRAIHKESDSLIGWSVPTGGSARRRMILWYSYETDSWLPPHTGMEYASLCEFTTTSGLTAVYMGDYWGRIYELFSGAKDGVPSESPTDNVREGDVISATSGTVRLDVGTGSLYTVGAGLAGMPVAVRNATGSVWQWRIIASNTADTITIDTTNGSPWTTTPDDTWTCIVGGIEWYWWTEWIDFNAPQIEKVLDHLFIQAKTTSADHNLEIAMRFNGDDGAVDQQAFTFNVSQFAGIWDVSLWDQAVWAEVKRQMRKKKIVRAPFTCQIRFRNYYPDQEIRVAMWGLTSGVRPGQKVPSVSA